MPSRKKALELIKKHEGLSLEAYPDVGGVSIGYGHRLSNEGDPPPKIKRITPEQANKFLNEDLEEARNAVENLVKSPIGPNKKAALTSFAYNVGAGKFKNSGVLQKVNEGDHKAASSELKKWVHAKGKKLSALVKRRHEEASLYETPPKIIDFDKIERKNARMRFVD